MSEESTSCSHCKKDFQENIPDGGFFAIEVVKKMIYRRRGHLMWTPPAPSSIPEGLCFCGTECVIYYLKEMK